MYMHVYVTKCAYTPVLNSYNALRQKGIRESYKTYRSLNWHHMVTEKDIQDMNRCTLCTQAYFSLSVTIFNPMYAHTTDVHMQ